MPTPLQILMIPGLCTKSPYKTNPLTIVAQCASIPSMTVEQIVSSKLSTKLLEALLLSTRSLIRNLQIQKVNPNNLIGWEIQLRKAIDKRYETR
jgi:hypothetical protein